MKAEMASELSVPTLFGGRAEVGHGTDAVVIQWWPDTAGTLRSTWARPAGFVVSPDAARALATILTQQADYADQANRDAGLVP